MFDIPEVIQKLFERDNIRKNFRVHFLDLEIPDLTNVDIESESVKFTESISSSNTIQIGSIEGSSLEFICHTPYDIKYAMIEAGIEIDIDEYCGHIESEAASDGLSVSAIIPVAEEPAPIFTNIRIQLTETVSSYTIYIQYDEDVTALNRNAVTQSYTIENSDYIDIPNLCNYVGYSEISCYTNESSGKLRSMVIDYADSILSLQDVTSFSLDMPDVYHRAMYFYRKPEVDYNVYYLPYGTFKIAKSEKTATPLKRKITAYSNVDTMLQLMQRYARGNRVWTGQNVTPVPIGTPGSTYLPGATEASMYPSNIPIYNDFNGWEQIKYELPICPGSAWGGSGWGYVIPYIVSHVGFLSSYFNSLSIMDALCSTWNRTVLPDDCISSGVLSQLESDTSFQFNLSSGSIDDTFYIDDDTWNDLPETTLKYRLSVTCDYMSIDPTTIYLQEGTHPSEYKYDRDEINNLYRSTFVLDTNKLLQICTNIKDSFNFDDEIFLWIKKALFIVCHPIFKIFAHNDAYTSPNKTLSAYDYDAVYYTALDEPVFHPYPTCRGVFEDCYYKDYGVNPQRFEHNRIRMYIPSSFQLEIKDGNDITTFDIDKLNMFNELHIYNYSYSPNCSDIDYFLSFTRPDYIGYALLKYSYTYIQGERWRSPYTFGDPLVIDAVKILKSAMELNACSSFVDHYRPTIRCCALRPSEDLYPAADLYPSEDLYPVGRSNFLIPYTTSGDATILKSLWWDDTSLRGIAQLSVSHTYKGIYYQSGNASSDPPVPGGRFVSGIDLGQSFSLNTLSEEYSVETLQDILSLLTNTEYNKDDYVQISLTDNIILNCKYPVAIIGPDRGGSPYIYRNQVSPARPFLPGNPQLGSFEDYFVPELEENLVNMVKDLRYTKCKIKMKALPFLELGDYLAIQTQDSGFETLLLRRTITGIKSLTDTIEIN